MNESTEPVGFNYDATSGLEDLGSKKYDWYEGKLSGYSETKYLSKPFGLIPGTHFDQEMPVGDEVKQGDLGNALIYNNLSSQRVKVGFWSIIPTDSEASQDLSHPEDYIFSREPSYEDEIAVSESARAWFLTSEVFVYFDAVDQSKGDGSRPTKDTVASNPILLQNGAGKVRLTKLGGEYGGQQPSFKATLTPSVVDSGRIIVIKDRSLDGVAIKITIQVGQNTIPLKFSVIGKSQQHFEVRLTTWIYAAIVKCDTPKREVVNSDPVAFNPYQQFIVAVDENAGSNSERYVKLLKMDKSGCDFFKV
jgi:hypothetical protein